MSYLEAIRASVPQALLDVIGLSTTQPTVTIPLAESTVDILLQLAGGASCPANLQAKHEKQWKEGQERFLSRVGSSVAGLGKRTRVADEEAEVKETNGASSSSTSNKKPKIETSKDERGEPRYTLHAISVSTPVRKKVDVAITSSSLLLSIPSSSSSSADVELAHPPIPLSSFKRAFLVPNFGKNRNKPHWTLVFVAADVVSKKSDAATQMQVVFTVDRAPTGKDLFSVTDHTKGSEERSTRPKGTETQPFLETFLSFLPPNISRVTVNSFDMAPPQQEIFKSSFNQPYLDTYRAAKEGSLYFLPEGV